MKKICILSGAGMSAESGIKTFRDADGLWEGHDVMQVASPEGYAQNPSLVLDFYNQRRKQLHEVEPNYAHKALVGLEKHLNTVVITQNVDDLHERAGSTNIIHLHGELRKIRSIKNPSYITSCEGDIQLGDLCPEGGQLRPHIVWFGEAVPELENAINEVLDADFVMIIGTSMQVYPAASLTAYAPPHAKIFYIDPRPQINYELSQQKDRLFLYEGLATKVIDDAINEVLNSLD